MVACKSIEAIVERQQGVPAEGNDDRFLLDGRARWSGKVRARSAIGDRGRASST